MRTKLTAVMVIPSVAFLVLAGVQTSALVGRTGALSEFTEQVRIGREITGLVHQLQEERDRTAGELAGTDRTPDGAGGGPEAVVGALQPFYTRTDEAVDQFRAAALPLVNADASWRVSYARVDEGLGNLRDVRAAVPVTGFAAATVLGSYHRLIDALLSLLAEPSPGVEQPALTNAVLRYVQFARIKEIGSQIRGKLYAAGRAGSYRGDDLVELGELRAQQLTAFANFRLNATSAQLERYEQDSTAPDFLAATRMEESTVDIGPDQPPVLDPDRWWTATEHRQEQFRQLETTLVVDAVAQAESRSAAQLRSTLFTATAVLAVLLAALLTSVVIGRSIARSLRRLRAQALRVAEIELPEALEQLRSLDAKPTPIEVAPAVVRSMDEIGEVAEAFVAVHRSAVSVAGEQAAMRRNVNAMFINLARRSQVLVERQLELLDELEREEGDPDQLDNLFKLDHLAARMRRNDESLLVLAGTESGRRWNRPVPLSAVMLAAVAEIEQYQRVRHGTREALHVVGHAVADLVHLLAELLENATSFSRPDTFVHIMARVDGPGSAAIEIIDAGLGMSPTALAEANELLANPPAADVAASERMGLFVVSHLAARQGMAVQLHAGAPGLVAVVRLPAAVLAAGPVQESELAPSRRMLAALAAGNGGPGTGGAIEAGPPTAVGRAPSVTGRSTVQRSGRRAIPTRAEDVLAPVAGTSGQPASTWWARPGRAPGAGAGSSGRGSDPVPPGGPIVSLDQPTARRGAPIPATGTGPDGPVAARIGPGGLPVRVPMAHLPPVAGTAGAPAPAVRHEPDPEAVGGMLSRFYGGVRRAETEESTDIMTSRGAAGRQKEQQ